MRAESKLAKLAVCISILNSTFPEIEFGHEGSNDVMVHDHVDVFLLEFEVDGIQGFKDVHQVIWR